MRVEEGKFHPIQDENEIPNVLKPLLALSKNKITEKKGSKLKSPEEKREAKNEQIPAETTLYHLTIGTTLYHFLLSNQKHFIGHKSSPERKYLRYINPLGKIKVECFNQGKPSWSLDNFYRKLHKKGEKIYNQGFREGFFSAKFRSYMKVENGRAYKVIDENVIPEIAKKLLRNEPGISLPKNNEVNQKDTGESKEEKRKSSVLQPSLQRTNTITNKNNTTWPSLLFSRPLIALYSIVGTAAVCHYDLIQKFFPWGRN